VCWILRPRLRGRARGGSSYRSHRRRRRSQRADAAARSAKRAGGRPDRGRGAGRWAGPSGCRFAMSASISFWYLLRYVDEPAAAILEMARCRRPGGTMASLEFFVPPAAGSRARVARLRVRGAVTGRLDGRRERVVAGGLVPERERPGPLPAVSARLARPRLGAGQFSRCWVAVDESRWWPGDVGDEGGPGRDPRCRPAGVLRGRRLPARTLRRRTQSVHGRIVYRDGAQAELDQNSLLSPLESALRAVAYGLVTLAVAMVASRL
jgi:hypothetical protein